MLTFEVLGGTVTRFLSVSNEGYTFGWVLAFFSFGVGAGVALTIVILASVGNSESNIDNMNTFQLQEEIQRLKLKRHLEMMRAEIQPKPSDPEV